MSGMMPVTGALTARPGVGLVSHPTALASLRNRLQLGAVQRATSREDSSSRQLSTNALEVAAVGQPADDARPADEARVGTGAVQYQFACPICFSTELTVAKGARGGRVESALHCARCARTFEDAGAYVDLTLTSGAAPAAYRQPYVQSVELFRSPVISFVYERGWRQGFASAGFPGPDAEFDAAMRYLAPAHGGTLLDMSCGSGLFTRRFVKSGAFARVVAADFSESMLQQTQQFIADDASIAPSAYCLVRADVGRMPFATGALPGVHAGAAIHCWPNPQAALAEISRVLAPGGVFVGTTFLNWLAPLGQVVGDDALAPLSGIASLDPRQRSGFRVWSEPELRDLCAAVGLTDFRRERRGQYIMFAATKPGPAAAR